MNDVERLERNERARQYRLAHRDEINARQREQRAAHNADPTKPPLRVRNEAEHIARSEAARVPAPLVVPLKGARCVGLTDLMFSEDDVDIAAAVAICVDCPVSEDCLERAITNGERFGVWGGQRFYFHTALKLRRERRAS